MSTSSIYVPQLYVITRALLSMIVLPGIGYLAPVIGLRYSTRLLPSQFWTEEQHQEVRLTRARAVANVFPYLLATESEGLDQNVQMLVHLNHVWLNRSSPITSTIAYQLMCYLGWYRKYRVSLLRKHSLAIQVEDQLLLRTGIDQLDLVDLQQLCLNRCIYPCTRRDHSKEPYVERLKRWLEMYPVITRCDSNTITDSSSFIDPMSFLLKPVDHHHHVK